MQITLNNLSLTSSTIISSDIHIDQSPTPSNNNQPIYRRDRSKFISRQFSEKSITISGNVITGSPADLISAIDSLRQASADLNMVLDVTYDSGDLRRYIVNLVNLDFPRKAYNITTLPFVLELVASNPIAFTPTYTDFDYSLTSQTTDTQLVTFLGTFYPEPIITLTFSSGSTTVALGNDYLGQIITLVGSVSTSDVIVIDVGSKSVTKNSVAIDYTGVFPQFTYGNNNITITLGTSSSCAVNVHYQPRFL